MNSKSRHDSERRRSSSSRHHPIAYKLSNTHGIQSSAVEDSVVVDVPTAFRGRSLREQVSLIYETRKMSEFDPAALGRLSSPSDDFSAGKDFEPTPLDTFHLGSPMFQALVT